MTILIQYYITLPPNLAEQLKWSAYVNTVGLPGHNISCDLHNEHSNKIVKVAVEGLGANKSKKAITRAGKAIGVLSKITTSFDKSVGVHVPSGKQRKKTMEKDIDIILKQLIECDVFNSSTQSSHKSFCNLKVNMIQTLDETPLKEWMVEHFAVQLQPLPTVTIESDNDDSD